MAFLYFSGNQAAFFNSVHDTTVSGVPGARFTEIHNPFLETDIVRVEIRDADIKPNGEIDFDYVRFLSVVAIRDGVEYPFRVSSGSKIKESGGAGDKKEQGDTFFTTADQVRSPLTGPFSSPQYDWKMVFTTAPNTSFTTGGTTNIRIKTNLDLDGNGSISSGVPETGNGNFNVRPALTPPVICFAGDTLIETDHGDIAAADIRAGDMVLTRDHGFQPVLWAATAHIGSRQMALRPALRPVRIAAGALGPDMPRTDLTVSQQHRILLRSRITRRMFGAEEVLVAAKHLVGIPGITISGGDTGIDYVHFMFARHEIVFANGAEAESLYAGPEALKALEPGARTEILALFPELLSLDTTPAHARKVIAGRDLRKLSERHARNRQSLVTARAATHPLPG